jgi:hypothetical protein
MVEPGIINIMSRKTMAGVADIKWSPTNFKKMANG